MHVGVKWVCVNVHRLVCVGVTVARLCTEVQNMHAAGVAAPPEDAYVHHGVIVGVTVAKGTEEVKVEWLSDTTGR